MNVLHDYILIERLPADRMQTSSGGIIMVNADANGCKHATVLAVGPGRTSETGVFFPQPVKVGDLVLTFPHPGTPHKLDGRDVWFIRPADILAVVGHADPEDAAQEAEKLAA